MPTCCPPQPDDAGQRRGADHHRQQRALPTGSYTNTGGNNGAVNPFTTVERKDVGLMLRVRPQISERTARSS